MNALIYTAVGLITCASVFGLSDYFSAKKSGTLVNYNDESLKPVQVVVRAVIPAHEKQIAMQSTSKRKRAINLEMFSSAAPSSGLQKQK